MGVSLGVGGITEGWGYHWRLGVSLGVGGITGGWGYHWGLGVSLRIGGITGGCGPSWGLFQGGVEGGSLSFASFGVFYLHSA